MLFGIDAVQQCKRHKNGVETEGPTSVDFHFVLLATPRGASKLGTAQKLGSRSFGVPAQTLAGPAVDPPNSSYPGSGRIVCHPRRTAYQAACHTLAPLRCQSIALPAPFPRLPRVGCPRGSRLTVLLTCLVCLFLPQNPASFRSLIHSSTASGCFTSVIGLSFHLGLMWQLIQLVKRTKRFAGGW